MLTRHTEMYLSMKLSVALHFVEIMFFGQATRTFAATYLGVVIWDMCLDWML